MRLLTAGYFPAQISERSNTHLCRDFDAYAILQTGKGPETQRALVSRRVSRFYWLTTRFLLVLGVEGDFPRHQTWPLKVGVLSKSPLCDHLLLTLQEHLVISG